MKGKKVFLLVLVLVVILAGYFFYSRFLIDRDEIRINPRVQLKPDASYSVNIWLYPLDMGLIPDENRKPFKEEVSGWLKEWEKTNSQINIKLSFIDPETGEWELKEALDDQNPPDLYFPLNFTRRTRQLAPADLYLKAEDYPFWSLEGALLGKRILGWPVAAWPVGFLIGENTWKDLKLPPSYRNQHLINPESLFQENILKDGLQLLIPIEDLFLMEAEKEVQIYLGDKKINQEDMERFLILAEQYRNYYFREKMLKEEGAIASILKNGRGVIGPVNPWLLQALTAELKRRGKKGYFLFLTSEKKPDEEQFPLYFWVYELLHYYQRPYKGDEHTKASSIAAEFFSRKLEKWFAGELSAIKIDLNEIDFSGRDLTDFIVTGISSYPFQDKFWLDTLKPSLIEFWEGDISSRELMKIWDIEKNK